MASYWKKNGNAQLPDNAEEEPGEMMLGSEAPHFRINRKQEHGKYMCQRLTRLPSAKGH